MLNVHKKLFQIDDKIFLSQTQICKTSILNMMYLHLCKKTSLEIKNTPTFFLLSVYFAISIKI